jgi:AcrR family transcriptional regulator
MSTSPSYHHGNLRASLIAAAETLLEKAGLEGVSLREAARTAGVSHNAPYRHFANREALLAAVAAGGFARLAAAMDAAGGGSRAAGRAYLAFAAAHPALYRLMFGPGLAKDAHPELRAAAEAAMRPLRAIGAAGASRQAAVGMWALLHGLAVLLADGQLADDLAARPEELAEAALATYGAGLRAAPAAPAG